MFVPIYSNNKYSNSYRVFVADTEADVAKIQVAPRGGNMGSEVFVIETQKTYILDSKNECDCVEESTIWEDLPNPTK